MREDQQFSWNDQLSQIRYKAGRKLLEAEEKFQETGRTIFRDQTGLRIVIIITL